VISYQIPERPPAMPVALWSAALNYRPQAVAEPLWIEIRPVVLTVIARYRPPTLHALKTTLTAVSQLFAWSVEQHLALDIEVVLSPDPVARFIGQTGGSSTATDASTRSRLAAVGREVTKKAPWPGQATSLPRTAQRPVCYQDLIGYARMSDRQATASAARVFKGLLMLCNGAGASGGQATRAHTDGLHQDETGRWCVWLDSPDRAVPLVADYVPIALSLATEHPGQPFLTSGERSLSWLANTVADFRMDTTAVSVNAGRLRTTWIVNRLNSGAHIKTVAEAAGLTSGTFLTDVLPYLAEPKAVAADPMTAALSHANQPVGLCDVTG
jgi:hypothetical protein